MNRYYYFIFFILLIFHLSHAGISRFHRIFSLYNNPESFSETRNVSLGFASLREDTDPWIDGISGDTIGYHWHFRQGNLAYYFHRHQETRLKSKYYSLSTAFNINYNNHGNTMEGSSSSIVGPDTTNYSFMVTGLLFYNNKSLLQKRKRKNPWRGDFSLHLPYRFSSEREKNFEPLIEEGIPVEFKRDRFIKKKQSITLIPGLTFGIGIGRQYNSTPLYQTFHFEKILRKNNLINFVLADKTHLAITKLLAEHDTYKRKERKFITQLKARLDSILVKDEAVERKMLRYISPLEIQKTYFSAAPLLKAKTELTLFTRNRFINEFYYLDMEFPYDGDVDYSFAKHAMAYEHLLGLQMLSGIPLSRHLFLELQALRILLATNTDTDFISQDKKIKWNNVLDVRLDLGLSFWLTRWLLCQGGLVNLPTWMGVPRERPFRWYVSSRIFVEDYLILRVTLSHNQTQSLYHSYNHWFASPENSLPGVMLRVTGTYTF